jgi:hypothetical protein
MILQIVVMGLLAFVCSNEHVRLQSDAFGNKSGSKDCYIDNLTLTDLDSSISYILQRKFKINLCYLFSA